MERNWSIHDNSGSVEGIICREEENDQKRLVCFCLMSRTFSGGTVSAPESILVEELGSTFSIKTCTKENKVKTKV